VKILNLKTDFMSASKEEKEHLFDMKHIENLKEYSPLSKIKELFLPSKYQFRSSSVIIQLLNISTLGMNLQLFRVLIEEKMQSLILRRDNHELDCLSKNVLFDDSYSIEQFCDNYPHLENLFTNISPPTQLLTLLRRLPRFSLFQGYIPLPDSLLAEDIADDWADELIPRLITDFHIRKDHIRYNYQSAFVAISIRRTIGPF
jgi:hypothetical protein